MRIFALSETGHEITLDVYGPGECFGETALLDGNLRSTGAMAVEKTVTYTLRRDDFLRCLERHPQVARRVMGLLAHRLEHATAYAENLAFLDVAGRVAAVLLELADALRHRAGSIEFDLHLTQAELASWVCASREMVNKSSARVPERRADRDGRAHDRGSGSRWSQAQDKLLNTYAPRHCVPRCPLHAPYKPCERNEFSRSVKQFIAAGLNSARSSAPTLESCGRRSAYHRVAAGAGSDHRQGDSR